MGTTRRVQLVVVLLVVLAVQGRLSFRSPEPYPTVRLPPFDHATEADGTFRISKTRITVAFADGTRASLGTGDLMRDFPFSTSGAIVAHVFGTDAPEPPPDVVSWLERQVAGLDPGSTPTSVTFCFQDADLDVASVELRDVTPCRQRTVPLP